jgi:hypothetical protein
MDNKTKERLQGISWMVAACNIFVIGLALWVYIAYSSTVYGPISLTLFSVIALTSSVGVGVGVAVCSQRAHDLLTAG